MFPALFRAWPFRLAKGPVDSAAAPEVPAPSDAKPLDRVGRGDVDHAQLDALIALPAVDRKRAGDVDGAAAVLDEGVPELLPGRPERDCRDHCAVARLQSRPHMGLA